MKHLITGESIREDEKRKITNILEENNNILEVNSLKIVSIGSNNFLALVTIDYADDLKDHEIVDINKSLINDIQIVNSSITEIYFNPK